MTYSQIELMNIFHMYPYGKTRAPNIYIYFNEFSLFGFSFMAPVKNSYNLFPKRT